MTVVPPRKQDALRLPPDAPAAHRLLSSVWPYLRGAARRAAPRFGIGWEDLLHDFAIHVIEQAEQFDPEKFSAKAFACMRIKHVLSTRFVVRWRLMSRCARTHLSPEKWTDHGPADITERADLLNKLNATLGRITPRRRQVVEMRFGLKGPQLVGVELGKALGILPTTANELVQAGLRDMAERLGADVEAAGVDRGEGIALGHAAKKRRTLAA